MAKIDTPIIADGTYPFEWGGGKGTFELAGTWGSGTAIIQFLARDGSTYVNLADDGTGTLTADGAREFTFRRGTMAIYLDGSTTPNLYPSVDEVRER